MSAARDAPAAPGRGRLVVISHGNGGTPWTHRGLATALAGAGYVVALPKHPGNSVGDNREARTEATLINRPRQLARSIDAALADPLAGPGTGAAVAAFGHSLGGYTVLAAAGGRPCRVGDGRPLPVAADPRIEAVGLLAPATDWFRPPGGLEAVRAPAFARLGEHDALTPPGPALAVLAGLPGPADAQVVAGAGHFSFLSPFPAALQRPDFAPAQDPPGFDRLAYQPRLAAEIIAFLDRALAD